MNNKVQVQVHYILKISTKEMKINKIKLTKFKMEINLKIKWMFFISIWTKTKTRPHKMLQRTTTKKNLKQMKNMTNLSIKAN